MIELLPASNEIGIFALLGATLKLAADIMKVILRLVILKEGIQFSKKGLG